MRARSYVIAFVDVLAGLSAGANDDPGNRLKSPGFAWIVSSGGRATKQFRG
jgi:hypothetical protein